MLDICNFAIGICAMQKSGHKQTSILKIFNLKNEVGTYAIKSNECAKVGTFPPSYAVIPSFISCFITLYCIDPYFIFFLNTSAYLQIL